MSIPRRDFLKNAAVAGVGGTALGSAGGNFTASRPDSHALSDQEHQHSHGKSVHTVLDQDPPFIYVDPCMQIWPDGDLHLA